MTGKPSPQSPETVSPLEHAPYDLRGPADQSALFYSQLATLSREVEKEVTSCAGAVLTEYANFLKREHREPSRELGEYGVELLTLGLFRERYQVAAQRTPTAALVVLRRLFKIRQSVPLLKPLVDRFRGLLTGLFLVPALMPEGPSPSNAPPSEGVLARLTRLISWLEASGEFKDEVKRLARWKQFLTTLPPPRRQPILDLADSLFARFREQSASVLAPFTAGVESFRRQQAPHHRYREDALFVSRTQVEYHLNMVSSEIMNRGLLTDFTKTERKVVLVPGCMAARPQGQCQARLHGLDLLCSNCEKYCRVSQLVKRGRELGFAVRIVPHSSSFTRWLKRYQSEKSLGLIAVACPLNIVAGGYEMRELGLAAQCVLLDWSGCQKHWHPTGIPTGVNEERLIAVAQLNRNRRSPKPEPLPATSVAAE